MLLTMYSAIVFATIAISSGYGSDIGIPELKTSGTIKTTSREECERLCEADVECTAIKWSKKKCYLMRTSRKKSVKDNFQANITYGAIGSIVCDFSMVYTADSCIDGGVYTCMVKRRRSKVHCGGTRKKYKITNYEVTSDTGIVYIASFKVSKGKGKFLRCTCDNCIKPNAPKATTTTAPKTIAPNLVDLSEPTCDWTDWQNSDNPSGVGDLEYASKECSESGIVKYEVRLVSGGKVYEDVADITQNNLKYSAMTGDIFCRNSDQVGCQTSSNGYPIGFPISLPCCQDYEARFCCKPPEARLIQCKWSKWIDHDNPSDMGDFETPGPECEKHGVQKYEVATVYGRQVFTDVNDIPENTVVFNEETGDIFCFNALQEGCFTDRNGWALDWPVELPCCMDYKARFCCKPDNTDETKITFIENGETHVQANYFNNDTGILVKNVPPHGNLTKATFILGENTNLLHHNNSCKLSPLPPGYNLPEAAAGMKANRRTIFDEKDEDVYHIIKVRESRVGVKERKTLLHHAQSHCSNLPIVRTRDIVVPKEDFESGDVILVKNEGKAKRSCSIILNVCSTGGPNACGRGWANPEPPHQSFSFHQISRKAICVDCTYVDGDDTPTGCAAQNPDIWNKYCLCKDITSKTSLENCRFKENKTVTVDIIEEDEGTGKTFRQTTTYRNEYDRLAVTMDTPANNHFTEMKVIMNAHPDGWWHEGVYGHLQNNRMMKINNKCYVDTLPAGHFPIDMAIGMQEIAASNTPITAEDEVTYYSMLTNEGPIDISDLHELVKGACKNSHIFKSKEEHISKEESDHLINGGVVFRNSSQSTKGSCKLNTAHVMLTASSSWHWPNPEQGEQISVNNIVHSAESLFCYDDDDDDDTDYCKCSAITNAANFLDCPWKAGLRAHTDKFVSVQPDERIEVNGDRLGTLETITFHPIGGDIYGLKSYHGYFLSAQPDGSLEWNRSWLESWEEFYVIHLSSGKVGIMSVVWGNWISAKPDGTLACDVHDTPNFDASERFEVVKK